MWMCHSKKQSVELQKTQKHNDTMKNPLTISGNDEDAEVRTE